MKLAMSYADRRAMGAVSNTHKLIVPKSKGLEKEALAECWDLVVKGDLENYWHDTDGFTLQWSNGTEQTYADAVDVITALDEFRTASQRFIERDFLSMFDAGLVNWADDLPTPAWLSA